jgi:hypothetical protein
MDAVQMVRNPWLFHRQLAFIYRIHSASHMTYSLAMTP